MNSSFIIAISSAKTHFMYDKVTSFKEKLLVHFIEFLIKHSKTEKNFRKKMSGLSGCPILLNKTKKLKM